MRIETPTATIRPSRIRAAGRGRRSRGRRGIVAVPASPRKAIAPETSDERQEAEEDPAPVERLGHDPGDPRPEDAGQDPRGRERREHRGPEVLRQAAPDRDVGDRRDRAAADALDEARGDEHRHGHGRAGEHEPDREQRRARGRTGTRRRAGRSGCPATTIPTSEPTRNAENTSPYSSSPPSSRATIGMAVVTASASAATRVIVRTSPTVSGRRFGDHSPSSPAGTWLPSEALGVCELFRGHALRHAIRTSRRVQAAGPSRRPRPSRTGCGRPPRGARPGR